jgi:SAM-dependent methyltransferase
MALKSIRRLLPSPPSTNFQCCSLRVNPYELLSADPVIYDIGSKHSRGRYSFGTPPTGSRVVCVDILPGPGVDLVADAHDLSMVENNSVDCVVCVSVLMYCHDPARVIRVFHRILRPGGVLYLSVPFVFPYAPDPIDYCRFSYQGLKRVCDAFECLDNGFNRGPASTTVHILIHFLAILLCFNSKRLYGLNVELFTWLLFWLKYFDLLLARCRVAYVIHSGAYLVGRKR